MALGVPRRERRGVAVVDRHDAPVRDDVAGDAACDAHGVDALAELQLVDGAGGGRVLGESPQDLGGVVDRVVPLPRSRAVGGPFFFQAEDGIRAGTVTGVQTCALPIYSRNDGER